MRILLVLVLLHFTPIAQSADPHLVDSTPVFRASSEFVVLDALVTSKKTKALIGDLAQEDFLLTEDGAPQVITYFSRDQLPLSVVFLFDLTETVRSTLKPLAEGAHQILGHLKPNDECAVMVFSSHTTLLQDFTADRSLAAAAIAKASEMKTDEGTFIHEDMYESIDQALESTVPQSRRVLVWLTDGTANRQTSFARKAIGKSAPERLHSREEATDKLLHSGVVVAALIDRTAATDALVVAMDVSPFALLVGAHIGDIKTYAGETGGPVLSSSKTEVAARLSLLIDQLRQRYTLGYKPLRAKPPGTFCEIRLQVRQSAYRTHSDLGRNGIAMQVKRGYYR